MPPSKSDRSNSADRRPAYLPACAVFVLFCVLIIGAMTGAPAESAMPKSGSLEARDSDTYTPTWLTAEREAAKRDAQPPGVAIPWLGALVLLGAMLIHERRIRRRRARARTGHGPTFDPDLVGSSLAETNRATATRGDNGAGDGS